MCQSRSVRSHQYDLRLSADDLTSTEGESESDFNTLIDQHGAQYYRGRNDTFVKTTTVGQTSRRESGDDVDGGLGSNYRGSSIGSKEATNRRRSSRQAGLGDTSGFALSPEYDRADPMLAQRMSIADTTTEDLASPLEHNDRGISRSSSSRHSTTFGSPPANNAAMRQLGRSGYISEHANIAADLKYDIDSSARDSDKEIHDPYQTVIAGERSLKLSNQAAMQEARRKEARQETYAQSYSVDQIPPFQSLHPGEYGSLKMGPSVMQPALSPYAGYHATMYQNENVSFPSYHSPTELSKLVQPITQSSPPAAFEPNAFQQLKYEPTDYADLVHSPDPPAAQTHPAEQTPNPSNRTPPSVHPYFVAPHNQGSDHPTAHRDERSADGNDRSASPQEREKRQRNAWFFEAGRRQGWIEAQNLARAIEEALAQAQHEVVADDEMDDVEG
jgi:hypothetical protein